MDIETIRSKIDEIDAEIVSLYKARMEASAEIAEGKRENALPVSDPSRERNILRSVSEQAGEEFEAGARVLFSMLMELSKAYQNRLILAQSGLPIKWRMQWRTHRVCSPKRRLWHVREQRDHILRRHVRSCFLCRILCISTILRAFFQRLTAALPLRNPSYREQLGRIRALHI